MEGPKASFHDSGSDSETHPPSKEESPSDASDVEDSEGVKPLKEEVPQEDMQGPLETLDAEGDVRQPEEPRSRLLSNEHKDCEVFKWVPLACV